MFIAKQDGANLIVADHRDIFPDISFPEAGPSAEFLAANSCYPVMAGKTFNPATEQRQASAPYLEAGVVYLSTVVPMTAEQVTAIHNGAVNQQIATLENSITNRMWREDAVGSVITMPADATIMGPDMLPIPHPHAGMTSTQIIQSIDAQIAALRATFM